MRAGALRHRITIQEQMPVRDSFGGEDKTKWSTVATVWAAVEVVSGREFVEQAAAGALVTSRVRIRRRDGIKPSMEVVFGSRTLNIEAVLQDNANRETILMCSEVTGGQSNPG